MANDSKSVLPTQISDNSQQSSHYRRTRTRARRGRQLGAWREFGRAVEPFRAKLSASSLIVPHFRKVDGWMYLL